MLMCQTTWTLSARMWNTVQASAVPSSDTNTLLTTIQTGDHPSGHTQPPTPLFNNVSSIHHKKYVCSSVICDYISLQIIILQDKIKIKQFIQFTLDSQHTQHYKDFTEVFRSHHQASSAVHHTAYIVHYFQM